MAAKIESPFSVECSRSRKEETTESPDVRSNEIRVLSKQFRVPFHNLYYRTSICLKLLQPQTHAGGINYCDVQLFDWRTPATKQMPPQATSIRSISCSSPATGSS